MNALRIFLSLVDRPLPGVHQTAAPDVNRSVGRILSRPQDHSRGVQPARASPTLPPGMTVIPAKAGIHRDSGCARPMRSGLPDYESAHELADRPPSTKRPQRRRVTSRPSSCAMLVLGEDFIDSVSEYAGEY